MCRIACLCRPLVLLFAFLIPWRHLLAQAPSAADSARIVIVSPRVGEVIDAKERESYALFRDVRLFVDATFYMTDDSRWFVVIRMGGPGGGIRDSVAEISNMKVRRMSQVIDHFEEIKESRYVLSSGSTGIALGPKVPVPAPFPKADIAVGAAADTSGMSSIILKPEENAVPGIAERPPKDQDSTAELFYDDSEKLPLGKPREGMPWEFAHQFYFGFGASIPVFESGGVEDAFAQVEDRYVRLGFSKPNGSPARFNFSVSMAMSMTLRLASSWGVEVALVPTSGPSESQYGVTSVSALFRYQESPSSHWWMEGACGVARISLHASRTYDGIWRQDSLGQSQYLDLYKVDIDCGAYGLLLRGALGTAMSDTWEFESSLEYAIYPDQSTSLSDGTRVSLGLRDIRLRVQLRAAFD